MATEHCNAASDRNEQLEELLSVYRQLTRKGQKLFFRQLKALSDIRASAKLTDEEKEHAVAQWQKESMAELKRSFPKAYKALSEGMLERSNHPDGVGTPSPA